MDTHEWVAHINNHRCDKCEFQTENQDDIENHRNSHKKQSHNCDQCDYEANSKDDLNNHVEVYTKPQFNCNICNKEAQTEKDMLNHKQKEHSTSQNLCQDKCKKYDELVANHNLLREKD